MVRHGHPWRGDEEETTEETLKGQKEEKDPNSAREQEEEGGMEEKQGLRCGEASPDQGLGGTSGQKPNADSQRQLYKGPITSRGGRGRKTTQTAQGSRREGSLTFSLLLPAK